jgi:hypothetical protein
MPKKKTGLDSFVVSVEGESQSRESTRTSALAAMDGFLRWCSRNGEPPAAGGSPAAGGLPTAGGSSAAGGPPAADGSSAAGGSAKPQPFDDGGGESEEEEEEEGGKEAPSGPASWGYPPTFAQMASEQMCRVVLWQRT